jgi:succinoglycan biosynthesis protein ExoL
MHSPVRPKKTAVLFAPDVADATTVKRADSFVAHGYHLLMFGFRRDYSSKDFRPGWPYVLLGRTHDRRYGQRALALLQALPKLFRHRRALREAIFFHARNIDQLLLALMARVIARRNTRIVYEVLDVQPAFVGDGWKARLLRAIERFGLRRADLLVLSSPGFLRNYFAPMQGYDRNWFLLENKLPAHFTQSLAVERPIADTAPAERGPYRWVVGYCGLIRGQETFDLIARLAERLQGLVLFKFHGVLTNVDRQSFVSALTRLDNLVYEGPYVSPRDLPAIYGELDFAWAIDLENTEHNSRWLLPCRYYEAGYFGVPCLAAEDFEVGTMVQAQGLGWTFPAPYEEALVQFFKSLTQTEYDATRDRLLRQPSSHFVGGEDMAALLHMIDPAPVSRPAQQAAE